MNISKEERETIINYSEYDGTSSIFTNVRRHITKLLKIFSIEDFSEVVRNEDGRVIELSIEGIDERHVLMRNIPNGRKLSDEERAAAGKRFATYRKK